MVSEAAWWSIGLVTGGAVLSMLHTLASAIDNELHVREVKSRVKHLKAQYAKRMAELEDEEVLVVDEVKPEEPSLPERQAA